jgi:LacI family transcriptional regulator
VTVAERAGVSIASVSRVLNGLTASSAMVRRVRKASEELGYVPDATARSLKAGKSMQLAFAVENVANPVYSEMMSAIEHETKAAGFRLLLHSTGADPVDEIELLRGLRRRYVDGLIFSPIRITAEHLQLLKDTPVPVTVIGTLPEDFPLDSVRTDSRQGAGFAIKHLVEGGRRRVAFVNGALDTNPGTARRDGYQKALAAHGLPFDERLVRVGGEFTFGAGYRATLDLWKSARPDALFCAADLIAVGALRALAELGVRVPEDVAVVGMDDTELAAMCTPSLTSVSLGSRERARLAANLMLERLASPGLAPRRLFVEPKLVIRESSRASSS